MFDPIAEDYSLKRSRPWKALESFLQYHVVDSYKIKGSILDLGCGNGRNFELYLNYSRRIIGLDDSWKFLKIALQNIQHYRNLRLRNTFSIHLINADMRNLPFRQKSIKNTFSIATFHHIRKQSTRISVLNQIHDILKNQGFCLITVWRKWQRRFRKYFILDGIKRLLSKCYLERQLKNKLPEFGDKYISWTLSKENKSYQRFYHFFSKKEILNLIRQFKVKEFEIMGGTSSKDNFFILAQKIY